MIFHVRPQYEPASLESIPVRKYPHSFVVVGYHEIGGPPEFTGGPRYDVHGLNISSRTFEDQLELMEKAGWYPVNMRDLVFGSENVPKGRIPVVLTFDDGRATQYKILPDGSLDPNCAVGILLRFHRSHPDWPLKGSFYLIAGSDENGVPFDQEGLEQRKVRQLLAWGFEIGNHSLTHPSFKKLKPREIRRQISGAQAYLNGLVPGLNSVSLALPYGELPQSAASKRALVSGGSGTGRYQFKAILLFGGGPVPPPISKGFDPFRIPRIPPSPGTVERYISASIS